MHELCALAPPACVLIGIASEHKCVGPGVGLQHHHTADEQPAHQSSQWRLPVRVIAGDPIDSFPFSLVLCRDSCVHHVGYWGDIQIDGQVQVCNNTSTHLIKLYFLELKTVPIRYARRHKRFSSGMTTLP